MTSAKPVTTQHLLASRSTGELVAVDTPGRDRLLKTGGWFLVCSEPDELTTYTTPKGLRRNWRLQMLLRGEDMTTIQRIERGEYGPPVYERTVERTVEDQARKLLKRGNDRTRLRAAIGFLEAHGEDTMIAVMAALAERCVEKVRRRHG